MSMVQPPPRSYLKRMSSFKKKSEDRMLGTANSATILLTFPSSPLSIIALTRCVAGWNLAEAVYWPSMSGGYIRGSRGRAREVYGLQYDQSLLLSQCKDLASFMSSVRNGLFHQNVFASLERTHGPFKMESIGELFK